MKENQEKPPVKTSHTLTFSEEPTRKWDIELEVTEKPSVFIITKMVEQKENDEEYN